MKIWITKYALTDGITEHECDEPEGNGCYVYPGKPFASYAGFRLGVDAHASLEDAKKSAESARVKKIEGLRRQIARLEKLSFR